mmetsp:Transcript_7099/g.20911  ORF Transcript_7099/g.20911 Transcript_7099/m.20911 type:complete len:103 (-) Transcript_7099:288-596(-)|eukprot:CAMPEP_0119551900 /NCGR_PEP_ID=MMETSP1352-20130426/5032_1 /TAXON_ID=265584 /ORGANISM="Stauroneis constricta, Strain CCMP1120" /LENGTH=102 /DNA_ID=CAMNT_0007598025 /DNA_START=301 /DNA_END=609 /DNA_ORIENTATION=+
MTTTAPSPTRKINERKMTSNPEDLSIFVQDMLDQMNESFVATGNTIIGRMDQVGKRMDDLERSINDLMEQAGLEGNPNDTSKLLSEMDINDTSTDSKDSVNV